MFRRLERYPGWLDAAHEEAGAGVSAIGEVPTPSNDREARSRAACRWSPGVRSEQLEEYSRCSDGDMFWDAGGTVSENVAFSGNSLKRDREIRP